MRLIATIFSFLLLLSLSSMAQTLVVDTASDVVDGGDGVLSLREAVTQANATAGMQNIRFDATVFHPDSNRTIYLVSSLHLDDAAGVDISGMGATVHISTSAQDSIFLFSLNSPNNKISYLDLGHASGTAIRIQSEGLSNNEVGPGNKIHDIAGTGVLIEGSEGNHIHNNWIWNSTVYFSNGLGLNGDGIVLRDSADQNLVEANWFWNNSGSGIGSYQASENTFQENYIAGNHSMGLNIFEGTGENNILKNRSFKNYTTEIYIAGDENNNNQIIQNAIGDSTLLPDTLLQLYQDAQAFASENPDQEDIEFYRNLLQTRKDIRSRSIDARAVRISNNPKNSQNAGQRANEPQGYVYGAGLELHGSSDNLISGNIFSNGDYGIYAYEYYPALSDNNQILFNVFKNLYAGMELYAAPNIIISDNLFSNTEYAFYLQGQAEYEPKTRTTVSEENANVVISNNVIEASSSYYYGDKKSDGIDGGYYGDGTIVLYDLEYVHISGNQFRQVYNAISLEYLHHTTIEDNIFEQVVYYGITGSDFDSLLVMNNTFNTGGIYAYNYNGGDYGYFYAVDNEFNNPWYYGLYLEYIAEVMLNSNLMMNAEENGIYLYYCNSANLSDNEIHDTRYNGIYSYYTDSLYLNNNEIVNTANNGIEIYYADHVEMNHNDIHSTGYSGTYIYDTRHVEMLNNTVSRSGDNGIYLNRAGASLIKHNNVLENQNYGLYFYDDTSFTIEENYISGNSTGMYAYLLESPVLSGNTFFKNIEYGLEYQSSDTLDASGNYWGHANGPALTDTIYPGYQIGDRISGNVTFMPYLTAPAFQPMVYPVLDRLEPAESPREGGQPFAVLGRQMLPGAQLYLDGNMVSESFFIGTNRMTGIVPPGMGGYVDVVVMNPGGYADTLVNGFWYENYAPLPFDLLSPMADETVSEPQPLFTWQSAADMDGDDVEYIFMYSEFESFKDSLYVDGLSDTSYALDVDLEPNKTYFWRVLATDGRRGGHTLSETKSFNTDELSSVISENSQLPKEFALHQNYPNPFNPTTNIAYDLKAAADVELTMYNMLGQKVAVLINEKQAAGRQIMQFDASQMASGIYIYKIKISSAEELYVSHKKMILIK